jgi:dTDP-4-dehydrorhamnose 3,5-epimerase
MGRLTFTQTPLPGVQLIQRHRIGDRRGFLDRLFCEESLRQAGWYSPIAQINLTYTRRRGTVRGLHFQYPPHAETKLVACLRGAIWDVAVDLRRGSPSFLSWHAEELSAENQRSLLIPEGFAHGFQAMTDDVEMLYCHSHSYAPDSEGGLHPQDQALGIHWPLPISEMSERDASHSPVHPGFEGIKV